MTKDQHYVPQLYLKYFSQDNKGLLHVYDTETHRSMQRNTKSIAKSKYLYDINPEGIRGINPEIYENKEIIEKLENQIFENEFSKIEDVYKKNLEELFSKIKSGVISNIFSDSDLLKFSSHIVLQYLRTISFRDKLLNYFQKDLTSDEKSTIHLSYMVNEEINNRYMDQLLNGVWVIGKNNSRQILYTSDNPVIMGQDLFADRKLITFPISSEIIILIYSKDLFIDRKSPHNTLEILDKEKVIELNKSIIFGSKRYVFSKTNQSKEIAKIIKENHI